MASTSAAPKPRLDSEQAIIGEFKRLVQERETLSSAAIERRSEVAEHDLVIKTLEPLDADRKCFRLVGEVMVESSVATALPEVKKNRENLQALVESYERQLAAKQKEVIQFQERYKIKVTDAPTEKSLAPSKAGTGVLV